MKKIIAIVLVLLLMFTVALFKTPSNLDYVKNRAEIRWAEMGFEVVGYDGFQWGWTFLFDTSYGGAKVWHILKKQGSDITYNGFLWRWGDELHMYNLKAVDAIKP